MHTEKKLNISKQILKYFYKLRTFKYSIHVIEKNLLFKMTDYSFAFK